MVAGFAADGDFDSGRLGDGFVHAALRPGNVHTADGALQFIRSSLQRAGCLARTLDLRVDGGFTIGAILDPLTDDGVRFIGRLKGNSKLDDLAEPHLRRPVGRPPADGDEKIVELGKYRAESWRHAQRVDPGRRRQAGPQDGAAGAGPPALLPRDELEAERAERGSAPCSLPPVLTGLGERDTPDARLWVYGRQGHPCLVCGAPIAGAQLGPPRRVTAWCPRCQPQPHG